MIFTIVIINIVKIIINNLKVRIKIDVIKKVIKNRHIIIKEVIRIFHNINKIKIKNKTIIINKKIIINNLIINPENLIIKIIKVINMIIILNNQNTINIILHNNNHKLIKINMMIIFLLINILENLSTEKKCRLHQ